MSDEIDILSAIRQIAAERKIDPEEILEAIKDALKRGYEREYNLDEGDDPLEVEMDPEKGHIAVYVKKTVVNKVENDKLEITATEAKKIDPAIKLGDTVHVDITPEGDFGRIAAQTARQVIVQKLRESEKEAAINEVKGKIGTIEAVVIHKITKEGDVICEINRARAVMPKDDRVPTEFYQLGSRVKVLLKSLEEDARGKFIHVSRSDPDFLKELFRMEVPEIDSGTVEIMGIAREAGSRSKVAVRSNADGVDPIGSCVGQKGVRINAIMNELNIGKMEEKVDIILWDEDTKTYLMNAIRPAEALSVDFVNEKKKIVKIMVAADQHSLAVGREGQNVHLANKLTGWEIEIDSEPVAEVEKEESESEDATESENETAEGENTPAEDENSTPEEENANSDEPAKEDVADEEEATADAEPSDTSDSE